MDYLSSEQTGFYDYGWGFDLDVLKYSVINALCIRCTGSKNYYHVSVFSHVKKLNDGHLAPCHVRLSFPLWHGYSA